MLFLELAVLPAGAFPDVLARAGGEAVFFFGAAVFRAEVFFSSSIVRSTSWMCYLVPIMHDVAPR
jgi:hypothetical protein